MNGKSFLLALCTAVTLAGCAIGKPIPQATTYIVDPSLDESIPKLPRCRDALRMGNVRVASPYAGNALVYRLDDVRYASDPYHTFVAEPGAMFGNRIAEWLDRAGPFSAVVQPGSIRPAPYVLEATVTQLYGDFRNSAAAAAVLAVQFALIDQAGTRPAVVYQRTIERRVELAKASPDELVRGYGAALAQILSQVAPELSAHVTASASAAVCEH